MIWSRSKNIFKIYKPGCGKKIVKHAESGGVKESNKIKKDSKGNKRNQNVTRNLSEVSGWDEGGIGTHGAKRSQIHSNLFK